MIVFQFSGILAILTISSYMVYLLSMPIKGREPRHQERCSSLWQGISLGYNSRWWSGGKDDRLGMVGVPPFVFSDFSVRGENQNGPQILGYLFFVGLTCGSHMTVMTQQSEFLTILLGGCISCWCLIHARWSGTWIKVPNVSASWSITRVRNMRSIPAIWQVENAVTTLWGYSSTYSLRTKHVFKIGIHIWDPKTFSRFEILSFLVDWMVLAVCI